MVKIGDVVLLKSGGPEMIVTYIFTGRSSRDKVAFMKGFKKGDMTCEWQQDLPKGKKKTVRRSFKAITLMFPNGEPVAVAGEEDDDDDDDDY